MLANLFGGPAGVLDHVDDGIAGGGSISTLPFAHGGRVEVAVGLALADGVPFGSRTMSDRHGHHPPGSLLRVVPGWCAMRLGEVGAGLKPHNPVAQTGAPHRGFSTTGIDAIWASLDGLPDAQSPNLASLLLHLYILLIYTFIRMHISTL